MYNHLYDPQAVCAIWHEFFEPHLGKRARKLFDKATTTTSRSFLSELISGSLYDSDSGTYIPVTDTPFEKGRNHRHAAAIAEVPSVDGVASLDSMCLFANELRVEANYWSDAARKPKDRVSFGDFQVFTFEFDVADIEFFKTQMSWITPKKNPLECPMGELYKACSRYSDFEGISVVYSGGKSLHIHVVFSTAQADAAMNLSWRSSQELRGGLIAHWEKLRIELHQHLDTKGHAPDAQLRFSEQYRRLPYGTRIIDEGHLFGIPAGTELPQVVLWEKQRKRAAKTAAPEAGEAAVKLPIFFSPEAFCAPVSVGDRLPRGRRPSCVDPMTDKQVAYCSEQLKGLYPEWPRFAHLAYEHGRYVARFRNSADDHTPSSIMREDYQTIHLMGRNTEGLESPTLPAPLGSMLRFWCEELRKETEPSPAGEEAVADEFLRGLENGFREMVVDKGSAYTTMNSVLLQTVCKEALLMVVGPEGVGKTTALFKSFDRIARALASKGESQLAMFAFADYEAAEEKCTKFNELQEAHGFRGVVIRSFSRAYEEVCKEIGVRQIDRADAALEHGSLWKAIEALQPQVIAAFQRRHKLTWDELQGKSPVFFSVHGVMHGWRQDSDTRRMSAPSFWLLRNNEDDHSARALQQETTLGLAVHDEVKAEALIHMRRDELVRWVQKLKASDKAVWREGSAKDRLESFERFVAANGAPQLDGEPMKIDFETVKEVAKENCSKWETVTVRDSGEYRRARRPKQEDDVEHIDIYDACHGRRWRVRERNWWKDLAHQTILLTTEAVPTALVRASLFPWAILKLEAPLMPRMPVDVHARRCVTSANLEDVCRKFQDIHPDTYIVSNKAKTLVDTVPHVTARGSNKMIGMNVMQTMTFMPPQLYEQLQVLNGWTGRSDLVGLAHVDEFNQSAGRNMGFRWKHGVTHTLLINRRLYALLVDSSAIGASRYSWRLVQDKHQRSDATRH